MHATWISWYNIWWNPLACAVAEQVMTLLTKKTLLNGVKKKEKIFLKELKELTKIISVSVLLEVLDYGLGVN